MQPTTQSPIPVVPIASPPTQQVPASVVQQSTPKTAATINYTSLQLMNSTAGLIKSTKLKVSLTAAVLIGVGLIVIGGASAGALLIIISMIYIAKLQADRNSMLWKQFAQQNGWQVSAAALAQAVVPPAIAALGHSRKISDVISGTFSGNTFNAYTYSYTVGSGKHSTTYMQTIVQVVLQKPLPSFLLDSSSTSVLHGVPAGYEHISLEGSFDKSFKLYAPKDANIDVLSVISPDVMQTLIQNNTFQDIQSEAGSIWFMQYGDTRKQEQLPALFTAIEGLMPEFYHRLKSYKATNAAAHSYTAQATMPAAQIIKEEATSTSARSIAIIVVVVIFIVMMFAVIGFLQSAVTNTP